MNIHIHNRHLAFWAPVLLISGLLILLIALLERSAHADSGVAASAASAGIMDWITIALLILSVGHVVIHRLRVLTHSKRLAAIDDRLTELEECVRPPSVLVPIPPLPIEPDRTSLR